MSRRGWFRFSFTRVKAVVQQTLHDKSSTNDLKLTKFTRRGSQTSTHTSNTLQEQDLSIQAIPGIGPKVQTSRHASSQELRPIVPMRQKFEQQAPPLANQQGMKRKFKFAP